MEPRVQYHAHKSKPILPILKHTNPFKFLPVEFNSLFQDYRSTSISYKCNPFFNFIQQNLIVMRRDTILSP